MIKMDDFNAISNQQTDQQSLYQRKYYALKRKCEEVQQVRIYDECTGVIVTLP